MTLEDIPYMIIFMGAPLWITIGLFIADKIFHLGYFGGKKI